MRIKVPAVCYTSRINKALGLCGIAIIVWLVIEYIVMFKTTDASFSGLHAGLIGLSCELIQDCSGIRSSRTRCRIWKISSARWRRWKKNGTPTRKEAECRHGRQHQAGSRTVMMSRPRNVILCQRYRTSLWYLTCRKCLSGPARQQRGSQDGTCCH